mmetsp:Transcript_15728/g.51371  ORF Transcript_15728/g.51371 Transcript_15728/m.51371 type:complete len:242 (-) Transcript_15728:355-1080(-)
MVDLASALTLAAVMSRCLHRSEFAYSAAKSSRSAFETVPDMSSSAVPDLEWPNRTSVGCASAVTSTSHSGSEKKRPSEGQLSPATVSRNGTAPSVGPLYTVRPDLSMRSSSNSEKAFAVGEWMVHTTVRPSRARSARQVATSLAMKLSSPEVGSSRKSSPGLLMSDRAMLTRLACPPEMPRLSTDPMTVPAHLLRARRSRTSVTRAVLSSMDMDTGSRSCAVYMSMSRTVSSPMRVSNCST